MGQCWSGIGGLCGGVVVRGIFCGRLGMKRDPHFQIGSEA